MTVSAHSDPFRRPSRRLVVSGLALFLVIPCRDAWSADDGFAAWWSKFQAAVAAGDKVAVADMAHFPLAWENGKTREVPSRELFLSRFPTIMTADIRKAIARGRPEAVPDHGYSITWQAHGDEYSLYFVQQPGGGFRLDGLSEGPA